MPANSPVILTVYSIYPLYRRDKRKDYFTSALPWPQKGNAVVAARPLPLFGIPGSL